MTKAEERALEAYPELKEGEFDDMNAEIWVRQTIPHCRRGFVKGYEQAEKDLAMTLEDNVRNGKSIELEEEINKFRTIFKNECDACIIGEIANHFAEWGAEHAKKDDTPVPANLEEAADEYEKANTGIYPEVGQTSIRDAFIDGAKWQKEQMTKEAVECETVCIKDQLLAVLQMKEFRWTVGDKVRIIIVKED